MDTVIPEARRAEPGSLKSAYNLAMFRPRRGQLQECRPENARGKSLNRMAVGRAETARRTEFGILNYGQVKVNQVAERG
jgi:hypothetical protein